MSPTSAILQDLLAALRACGKFAVATLGDAGGETSVPRASLCYESRETFPADDDASVCWVRLKVRVTVHARADKPSEAALRAVDLCSLASAALLADPCRGGRCQDLPIGAATEIGRGEPGDAKRPDIEMSFALRCHFQEVCQ